MVKKNLGRRKVEMVKMSNKANLQVTFSKRRAGLFKKASELCTLCDVQLALIVFSPSGKAYSFGHPDIRPLLGLSNYTGPDQTNRRPFIHSLHDRLAEVMAEKEKEQRNKATLVQNERKNKNPDNWWRNSPNELSLIQVARKKHVLEDLKMVVADQLHQTNRNYYVGSSSNAAPTVINGGNRDLFHQNGMMTTPGHHNLPLGFNVMTTPTQTIPLGFNVMNCPPPPGLYNHSQILNQEFEDLKRVVDDQLHQTNPNYYVGSSSNAAPAMINGGNISANWNLFDQNGMTTPSHLTIPLGFDVVNRTQVWYNHSQVPNQEFQQGHPHHEPRYW